MINIEQNYVDAFLFFSTILLYLMLVIIYLLRAYEKTSIEFKLRLPYSLLMVPFTAVWLINLLNNADFIRIVAEIPILVYFSYDLVYRQLTSKKPYHHPDKMPSGLILYLILMNLGLIGLNFYAFIISKFYGNIAVMSFFVMLASYFFYQNKYNKRKGNVKKTIGMEGM
ncbi:MAG: hypothetical protein ACTSW1_14985 [Candidatus Hodarchaeales archaeon]